MKKIIFSLLVAMLLSGCVAGVLVAGGATAGGTIASDSRSVKTMAYDKQIAYRVQQQIYADPDLANQAHISAAVFNGVVLLVGQAPAADMRDKAAQLAQQVPHVRRIFNEITIGAPTSPLVRSKDTAITANVKARMLATTNLKSGEFKVVTEDGTVFILGLTSQNQAEIATTVARNSTGVKRVVKLIEYN